VGEHLERSAMPLRTVGGKMTKNWFEQVTDERKEIDAQALYLMRLSNAFKMTGNTTVASQLMEVAGAIRVSTDNIKDIVGKHVTEQFDASLQAAQASGNMLATALAVAADLVDEQSQ
jgi:hypothetical protein